MKGALLALLVAVGVSVTLAKFSLPACKPTPAVEHFELEKICGTWYQQWMFSDVEKLSFLWGKCVSQCYEVNSTIARIYNSDYTGEILGITNWQESTKNNQLEVATGYAIEKTPGSHKGEISVTIYFLGFPITLVYQVWYVDYNQCALICNCMKFKLFQSCFILCREKILDKRTEDFMVGQVKKLAEEGGPDAARWIRTPQDGCPDHECTAYHTHNYYY